MRTQRRQHLAVPRRPPHHASLHEYRQEGSKIQWIAQTATEYADLKRNLAEISALKPIAIYLHGNRTDSYWRAGQIEELTSSLKAIRQTGAMVGLGSHIPEVFDDAESKGWDVDFYMTCLYNLTRPRDEVTRLGGPAQGEYFRDADCELMLQRVKRAGKPCLIFKVYGATRRCATAASREAAMDLAFRYAKPNDAVVVGMFPKYTEQVAENCRFVVKAIANRST